MTTHPRIGFIGVGLMGHGMAKNLVEKGFPLTVLGHRNRVPVDDLVGRGAKEAKDAGELARASDIVFLCVTASPQVEAAVEAMAPHLAKGAIVCDCSTADPTSTEKLARMLAERGIAMADAPLGGTPVQAEAGQLSAMVGADDAVFARLKPAIEAWAARVVHLGPVGAGHKMKLINNFLSLGYAAIYAEAIALANKTGLSVEIFDKVIRGSRMDCGFYQTFMGYALEGNPESHKFTLANAYKDMRYVVAMGDSAGAPNPVASAVKANYAQAVGLGNAEKYVPMLADVVGGLAGVKSRR
jgi:3-hydroxyisobutyrate dehydrogenase-like beta-hydroxyacid dehydrogenase